MRSRDARNLVAEAGHHVFYIHGNQRFILDDEDFGSDLPGDIFRGLAQELGRLDIRDAEDFGGFTLRETFDRYQKKGLARIRRDHRQVCRRPLFPAERRNRFRQVDGDRRIDRAEQLEQIDPVVA
ncbi:hypothetical protein ASD31_06595 [Rhizobium sp. Root482]|nr:hypothetical protein ASD31_06595 [Rhizobium sp. Root482]